jgi:hypothetical protein
MLLDANSGGGSMTLIAMLGVTAHSVVIIREEPFL